MDLVTIYTDNHDTEATFKISRRTTEKLFTAKNRINFRLFDVDVVKDNATGKSQSKAAIDFTNNLLKPFTSVRVK